MRRCNTEGEKKKKRFTIAAALAALVLISFAGGTAARYVLQKQASGIAEATEFYFTSDLLKEESENAEYYVGLKNGEFTFTLYNSADSKRVSSVDIEYKVTVGSDGAGTQTGTVSPASGTLPGTGTGAGAESKSDITVTPNSDTGFVIVTAEAVSPYQKKLTAKFHLNSSRYFGVEDNIGDTAAVLTIRMDQAAATEGGIKIVLPEDVIPDATDGRVTADAGTNTYRFSATEPGVYSLVLLKTDKALNLNRASTLFADTIDLTQQ